MFKFNDTNIFTGYIKQLLNSFNLPKYHIYTAEQQAYHDDYVKNKQKYKEIYNGILIELDELKYAIAHEEDPSVIVAMKKRIKELEKQKIKVPHTPELNVFISSPRHVASTYTNRDAYQNEIASQIEEIKKVLPGIEDAILILELAIEEDEAKPITDPSKWSAEVRAEKEAELESKRSELSSKKEQLIKLKESQEATEIYPTYMRYIPYIKNNQIQIYAPKILADGTIEYSDKDWKVCHYEYSENHKAIHGKNYNVFNTHNYVENLKIKNYTKTLQIQNNVYDSYTHEYLGEYLRFQRDYNNIDLMPLYNCFSNRVCPKLNISIKVVPDQTKTKTLPNGKKITVITKEGYTAKFNTDDKNYKIYMVPVKLFHDYTIAIDSGAAVEMCCGLFGQYQYEDKYNEIATATYTCFNNMQFKTPKLFTAVWNLEQFLAPTGSLELMQHEEDLKLFIKVPFDNKSSVVVLEGDYTQYSDSIWLKTIDNDYTTTAISKNFYSENPIFLTQAAFLHKYLIAPFVSILEKPINKQDVENDIRIKEFVKDLLSNTAENPFPKKILAYYEDLINNRIQAENILPIKKIDINTLDNLRIASNNLNSDSGLNKILIQRTSSPYLNPEMVRLTNHTVINFEGDTKKILSDIPLITPLQLLRTNTDASYPFADRLIEYLVGNVITPLDKIGDNVKRAKTVTAKNTNKDVVEIVVNELWSPVLRLIYYNYINENYDANDTNHDILGYVDKEVEKLYSCLISDHYYVNGVRINKKQIDTISSVNIYEDKWED